MARVQACWVHGSSVQIEKEGYFISRLRAGYGTCFRSHGSGWFHFALPTPVLVDGVRTTPNKVFVLYKTELTAKITNIHVYDAGSVVAKFDGLSLSGVHDATLDAQNRWILPNPKPMLFGLGISVCVDFGPPSTSGVPAIWFTTAGGDFQSE